jgi:hypothetical protein
MNHTYLRKISDMRRMANNMRRVFVWLVFSLLLLSNIVPPAIFLSPVYPDSVYASEIQVTKTTQADWAAGSYENKEIDIATSSGDLKLALDVGSWDASGPANIDHAIGQVPTYPYYGNSKVLKIGRYLYTFRNTSYGQFLRYDMDTREWKEMAYVPISTYEVLDATTNGTSKIWAFATRNNRKHFLEYDIASNSWSFLANSPDLLVQGATLEYVPGQISYIYAFRGGSVDFYRYHLSGASAGTWEAIANPTSPFGAATCGTHCDLAYDGNRYLYLISESANPDRLYKYDTWSHGSAWPYISLSSNGIVGNGSDLVQVGTDFYMLGTPINGGAHQQALYKFDSTATFNNAAWSASTPPPYSIAFGSLAYDEDAGKIISLTDVGTLMYFNPTDGKWSYPLKGVPFNTYNGNSLMTSNGSTEIYQCRAQNTATCYTYNIASNTWSSAITYSTGNLADGSVMAYMNGSVYVGRGGSTALYSVNPTTGAATALAPTTANFGAGSAMAASGSADLFVLRGGSNTFRKYNTTSGWLNLANFPDTAGRGASLTKLGDYIYGIAGNYRGRMYRYHETLNSWEEVASLPVGVFNGGAMTTDNTRYLYVQSGGENDITGRYFYRYDSTSDIWEKMADTPAMIRYGGGLVYANGFYYSYQGYNKALWKYTPPTAQKYVNTGVWFSPEYDLQYASSFTSFTSSFTPADGVSDSVLFYARSSVNGNQWSGWVSTDAITELPAGRYAQIKTVLTGNEEGTVTPIVQSFTFAYNDDTTPPVITGLNLRGYSNSSKTTALTEAQTYSHRNPYFEWNAATDSETGIDSYYVYFGDQTGADPATAGFSQQERSYTVSSGLVTGTTYYLKVKAKNKAGNFSSTSADFSFTYEGISPIATATIEKQSDWDDPQATKSAVYVSSAQWWNQSYLYRQRLHISPVQTATAGSMIRVSTDTATLVASGKLRADRKDWRIAYFNGATWEEIDRQYENETTTYFPLKQAVNAGTSDTNYYIYYGNSNETTEPMSSIENAFSAAKWGGVGVYFDGGDYVRIPNISTALNGLTAVTIEGWFNYQNTNGTRILFGGYDTQQTSVGVTSGQNYLSYQLRTSASSTTYANIGTTYLVPNTWNHFSITYDSSTGIARGFVNGRLDFIRTGLTGTLVASNTQYIGYNRTGGITGTMYGLMDEVRISNTARYITSFSPQIAPYETDSNTLGLYHMDEGTGQTVADSSGAGQDGVLGSAAGVDGADPLWMSYTTAVNLSEENAPVSADSSLMLRHSSNGTWANEKLPSLPWGGRLQYGAAVVANNSLYVVKGYNTPTFYKLDFSTNLWTQLVDLPANSYYGSSMAFDGNDSIYITRGNTTTDFWKYSISGNSFTTGPTIAQPANPLSYGAAMVKGKNTAGDDVLFVLRGSSDDLLMYYLNGQYANTWATKASAPFSTYYGSGLAYDSASGLLWLMAGNGVGFAKYNISGDIWDTTFTSPALPPYSIAYASNNMFIYGDYLYTFTSVDLQANNEKKNYIWRYSKSSDKWENIQTDTEFWMYTGALAYDGERYAYLINGEGAGQTAIARFDVKTHSYYPETPNLPQDRLYTNNGERIVHQVSTGTSLAFDNDDAIYMAQGGTTYINKYQVSTKRWTQLPNLPVLYYGNLVHTGTDLYVIASHNSKKIFRYDEGNKHWKELPSAPDYISNAGNQTSVYDGSGAIYVLRGANTTHLYKYTLGANDEGSWATESATIPAAIGSINGGNSLGASMTFNQVGEDKYLYIFRGNATNSFYRYHINSSTWTFKALVPEMVYQGSGSVLSNGKIFLTTGFFNTQMYIYDIATDTYMRGINTQSHMSAGGAITKGPGASLYLLQGNGMYTFWKYNIPTATTAYNQYGQYTTKPILLDHPYSFAGLSATFASPSATSVRFETRTSTDSANWSVWSATTGEKKIAADSYGFNINSNVAAYMQVKATLVSDEGMFSPNVSNIGVNYYNDSTKPINPNILSSYTTASKSAALTADAWHNNAQPYFEWDGASDGTGSGISGYYVYFGLDSAADATESGTFVQTASFSASLLTDGTQDGEYYLKIKTVDNAGNISDSHWAPFLYLYDPTPPEIVASENVSVLPSGYTAVNNFTFNWIPSIDPIMEGTASGLFKYYYKTGTASGTLSQYQPYTGTCSDTMCTLTGITAYQEGVNTFYLRVHDVAGNVSAPTTINYNFNSIAPSPPRNLAVDTSNAAANKFSFTWDEPSVYRGTIKEYRYSVGEPPNASNISTTSAKLVNNVSGIHDGENRFYVVAVDEADNVNYNNYASRVFNVSVSAPGIPLAPEAFDNSIRATKKYRVGLTWDAPTDKGSAFDRYEIYASETESECSTDMSSYTKVGSTAGNSYVVTSIGETELTSKEYFLCITACASTNQCSSPSTTVSMEPSGRWLEAPDLVGSQSATVKTKSALITWSTDRTANSFVKYGTKPGDYVSEVGSSEQVIGHSINLIGLNPGTKYYYKILWSDEDGNQGSSDEMEFTTNPAPFVSGVKASDISIHTAYITFTSKNGIKARIEYGKTLSYGSLVSIGVSKSETINTIKLDNLLEGTLYHYRIVVEDDEGNTFAGDDYIFETLPVPKIVTFKAQQVSGMASATLRLLWTTNTTLSSIVTYYPTGQSEAARDQITLALKKSHEVILGNLKDDTEYTLLIKGRDSAGNEATYPPYKVQTAVDFRPPEILNMNVESTIIGIGDDARAQVIVSWDTDELSTTQVEYAQGTGSTYSQTTQEDTSLTTNHVVTITGLSPSKIYHLRAVSKDKGGNITQSDDTVTITPKSTKDALNLVIDNLSKTFGFLKGVKGL